MKKIFHLQMHNTITSLSILWLENVVISNNNRFKLLNFTPHLNVSNHYESLKQKLVSKTIFTFQFGDCAAQTKAKQKPTNGAVVCSGSLSQPKPILQNLEHDWHVNIKFTSILTRTNLSWRCLSKIISCIPFYFLT